ncbi:MAG: class II fructose-bisphosphate aldolase [Gemmatimonadetes bacterium]|nr:class II fructose-bisphosphate aldolase [Gemmatimonadota bacterium]
MSDALTAQSDDRALLDRPSVRALLDQVANSVRVGSDLRVEISDEAALRESGIEHLARAAALDADEDARDSARWIIGEVGQQLGIRPASIHDLYIARGRGEISGFTVPAMNIRAASYDSGRALFAAARELRVGALICEIARSEIGYTAQRPAEYVAVLTAAAIREGWSGPLFIQGDHFQINAKKHATDPTGETRAVRDLIREAIHAGFYNIDVDTSTLVDLAKDGLDAQQKVNYALSAELTALIRRLEPEGVTVSVGGEIGEVGTENSTAEELRAYMDGFQRELARQSGKAGRELAGLSKISVQSGTTHGGVVLADGSIADVAIDFDTLRRLSTIAREEYGLSGAVQHGASTLPAEAFVTFAEVETAEIHLATGFQNLLFDHPSLPAELCARMYEHCRTDMAGEAKEGETDEQFIYKTRKKSLGAFKQELWDLPAEVREAIRGSLQEQFSFLFRTLAVADTQEMVRRFVAPPETRRSGPGALRIKAAADDWDLSD